MFAVFLTSSGNRNYRVSTPAFLSPTLPDSDAFQKQYSRFLFTDYWNSFSVTSNSGSVTTAKTRRQNRRVGGLARELPASFFAQRRKAAKDSGPGKTTIQEQNRLAHPVSCFQVKRPVSLPLRLGDLARELFSPKNRQGFIPQAR